MNKTEATKIIGILKVAYPKFFISADENEARLQIDTWQDLFSTEPYKLVEHAVKALMCTLKFPPTIADVKEKITLITQPARITEMEAWGQVLRAIQSANYHSQENFDNLHPLIQKIVGSPNQLREWAMMESDVVNSVIQSNFMRSFTSKQKHEEATAMLPESTKLLIVGLGRNMGLHDGSD